MDTIKTHRGYSFPPSIRLYGCMVKVHMIMADTKRGRERKGKMKIRQRRHYEIKRELEARKRDRNFDDFYEELELNLESEL